MTRYVTDMSVDGADSPRFSFTTVQGKSFYTKRNLHNVTKVIWYPSQVVG